MNSEQIEKAERIKAMPLRFVQKADDLAQGLSEANEKKLLAQVLAILEEDDQ